MPILEAKAVGLPVITSDIEPMSEVGKGWATFADPSNSDALKSAVLQTLKEIVLLNETSSTSEARFAVQSHCSCYQAACDAKMYGV